MAAAPRKHATFVTAIEFATNAIRSRADPIEFKQRPLRGATNPEKARACFVAL